VWERERAEGSGVAAAGGVVPKHGAPGRACFHDRDVSLNIMKQRPMRFLYWTFMY
jgi:hypothetical protein